MGIAIEPPPSIFSSHQTKTHQYYSLLRKKNSVKNSTSISKCSNSSSMSENYDHHHHHHQGIFSFTQDDFDRATTSEDQIQRDKLRIQQGFEQQQQQQEAGTAAEHAAHPVGLGSGYESAGMLSEMFNFGVGASGGGEILDQHQQITGMNTAAESAAAMQLFLTHPQHRSPSPPPHQGAAAAAAAAAAADSSNNNNNNNTNSALHMLLPIQSAGGGDSIHHHHGYNDDSINQNHPQFSWINPENTHHGGSSGGVGEGGQGLSLSLSSSLQRLDVTKTEEQIRIDGDDTAAGMMFFGGSNHHGPSSSNSTHFKELEVVGQHHQQQHMMHHQLQGGGGGAGSALMGHLHHHPVHLGFSPSPSPSSLAVVNILRNSRYTRPSLELLEEFCSVGRGYNLIKKGKLARNNSNNATSTSGGGGGGGGEPPSSSNSATKDLPPLSPADRMEHQRRKVKLLSMLDEVERRYSHYCEQMQMVMNSFDLVMGFGAAAPYTALAQKAMSRHFRCLKDAIQAQLKNSCELLGEKDVTGSSGLSKGETPRLKVLEQSLRQQRAFHQMGMMEQEAWRPQRGLPERSVNVLRAWLFEHFLHPYPNDADKHLLARQTGLSRNQVSNWFINARVRLWKPMVEEMYQQEAKERERAAAAAGGGGHHDEQQDENLEADEEDAEDAAFAAANLHSALIASTNAGSSSLSEPTTSMNAFGAQNDPSYGHATALSKHATITRHQRQDLSFSENQEPRLTPPPSLPSNSAAGMVGPPTNADDFIHQTITGGGHVDACNDYGTTSAGFAAGYHHHHHQGGVVLLGNAAVHHHHGHQDNSSPAGLGPTLIRFGTSGVVPTSGDVSLTLGLRHGSGPGGSGGNAAPEKNNAFSFGDFGS